MAQREDPPALFSIPQVPINFVPAQAGDTFKIGVMTIRVMEDGSHTDNRLGAVELIIPPHTSGPPPHWHEMHDETFLVTKGTVRFTTEGHEDPQIVDAQAGDYVTVPIRAPHTFANVSGEEARFFNTFTPAFYVNYFKLMSELAEEAGGFSREINMRAMAGYATMPVKTG